MLTNGTIQKSRFGSFKELAQEVNRADRQVADEIRKNLATKQSARADRKSNA